jgi:urease accessory protein
MINSQARCGELFLRFVRRDKKTVIAESYFHTPLQVMQPISDVSGGVIAYLLSPTGGVVQGDEYRIDLVLEEGAHGIFTTQAATKVYRMPDCGAVQTINIEVHPGAVLEFIPDATILFKGADLAQKIQVTLHPGALLLMHDIIMPGRLARGEFMEFRRYQSRVVVRDEQGMLLYENINLTPDVNNYQQVGILEGYACWGNWYLLGALQDHKIDPAQFCLDHLAMLGGTSDALGSISILHRDGLCARLLSHTISPLYSCFEALRQSVRTQHLNLPYHQLRK